MAYQSPFVPKLSTGWRERRTSWNFKLESEFFIYPASIGFHEINLWRKVKWL